MAIYCFIFILLIKNLFFPAFSRILDPFFVDRMRLGNEPFTHKHLYSMNGRRQNIVQVTLQRRGVHLISSGYC